MARRRFFRRRRNGNGGIGIGSLRKAEKRVLSLQAASKNARAKLGTMMEQVLNAAVCGATGWGLGFATTKNAGVMPGLGPVPADLSLALAGHLLGLLGVGGKMDTHFKALGNGALTVFALRQGSRMGAAPAAAAATQGYDYALPAYYDDEDDYDVEGMALEPGDFAGLEII